jgi:hypothetical protein
LAVVVVGMVGVWLNGGLMWSVVFISHWQTQKYCNGEFFDNAFISIFIVLYISLIKYYSSYIRNYKDFEENIYK